MNPTAKAKCVDFVASVMAQKNMVKGPFGFDFLDAPLALIVEALEAAKIGLDVIAEWLPKIVLEVLSFTKSVGEVVDDILARIKAGETP